MLHFPCRHVPVKQARMKTADPLSLFAACVLAEVYARLVDHQSADALHLITRIKCIPQLDSDEVEARRSQRDREAGCGQRPWEGKAVVGRRTVHT